MTIKYKLIIIINTMIQITCYYLVDIINPEKDIMLIFIKYEKFFKIILNDRSIIISINDIIYNQHLYGYYILSVILTEKCTNISNDKGYNIPVIYDMNLRYFMNNYNNVILYKNPLNSKEPKRNTSQKKINKFMKQLVNYLPTKPSKIIDDYINQQFLLPYSEIYELEKYLKIK